ncbi:MAG: Polyphosphate kinase [uncultured Gemmatimonadaceae bacterium]|uniref:Polyphosphate kinase n=1 Tax=uncultured Gemmatimonadaceae bacterium TaxID=246130 RepID=A0A6J4M2Q4_9BACT|nr:MAG: Polyphosphate kinase [uncultured Gemmatimonadaceae bacterium]
MIDAVAESPLFLNRELSWLEFNSRVLHEAFDERLPLLERVKFLAIFSTNLDEFYMVRVAGLRRQVAAGVTAGQADGLTPQEQLDAIERRVAELRARAQRCLNERLLPALAEQGVRLVSMADLQPSEWLAVDDFFESQLFPVLTPLAVDPGHPFPYVSNLSLSLAVEVRDPDRGTEHFARVKVPKSLPRWVPFGRPNHFVPLEQVIGANLGALFPGMDVVGWWAFRVTRNSDLDITHQDVEDLLEMIEEQVFKRRFGEVVRLEVQEGMPAAMRELLLDEIREQEEEPSLPLTDRDVQEGGTFLELGDLHTLAALDLPELKDAPFTPLVPERLRDPARSMFEVIRDGDLLVHHPFESFPATVERFLSEAARDDNVLAIKMTLYRTSGDTAIVRALTEAAQRGKQVAVLVELQARFDETNNITWARTLEGFGVHVAYGLGGLKTHTKTTLVVRREADGIRRYVHVGTGNYNSKTARLYTDVGLFTCTPSMGADLSDLFNLLTGFSRQRYYRKLLVAPANMRSRFIELVDREAANAREGRAARIVAKMNALVDPEIIEALYRASQAGARIDLIVRGVCCLRPGVPGVSEGIRVTSIIGRFLEHSRIWYFANGGSGEYYVGSADWMPRNFDRRVEAVAPVEDPLLHVRLRALLDTCLADNRQAWELRPDGTYAQRQPGDDPVRSTHVALLRDPWGLVVSRDTPKSSPKV